MPVNIDIWILYQVQQHASAPIVAILINVQMNSENRNSLPLDNYKRVYFVEKLYCNACQPRKKATLQTNAYSVVAHATKIGP